MEGISGLVRWKDVAADGRDFEANRRLMTLDANAAIEGAFAGGVTEVVLALGFRPEPFIEAFPDGRCGDVELTYAVEPEPLDTAGAIRFAADAAGIDDTFVVANGDVLTDLDVAALVAAHRRFCAEATLHLIGVDDPSAFGVVDLDADGRISAFVEKRTPRFEGR